ncbi:MAG: GNAT family N-acetyltransferase, partial [Sciscionella sp.]|nr:GNAT family N-acetyltransferase [Sciscionella sp.]
MFSANKTVGGCWCTWFMRSNAELREDWGEGNRKVLQAKVFADEPLGLLAIEGDQPKGWVAVAPRPAYSRLGRSKVTASEGGAETWS